MKAKKTRGKRTETQRSAAVRASISFPPDVYETLGRIAAEKKVSLAWVVREAAEKYIADKGVCS
jgi:predicted DNA-binding protein